MAENQPRYVYVVTEHDPVDDGYVANWVYSSAFEAVRHFNRTLEAYLDMTPYAEIVELVRQLPCYFRGKNGFECFVRFEQVSDTCMV